MRTWLSVKWNCGTEKFWQICYIELLAERMEVARGIGELKRQHGMAIVQRERFNELLEAAEGRATAMGLSTAFIHQIFSAIHEESVRQQVNDMKKS